MKGRKEIKEHQSNPCLLHLLSSIAHKLRAFHGRQECKLNFFFLCDRKPLPLTSVSADKWGLMKLFKRNSRQHTFHCHWNISEYLCPSKVKKEESLRKPAKKLPHTNYFRNSYFLIGISGCERVDSLLKRLSSCPENNVQEESGCSCSTGCCWNYWAGIRNCK